MQRISEKMMAGPLWVGCSFSWSKTLPPLNSQCLIVGKISSIKGLIVYCLFGLKWKRRRDEKREARKGVSLCFWNISRHILGGGFQATASIAFKVYYVYCVHTLCTCEWGVCVWVCGGGGKEKEKQRGKCWRNKMLWFDYLSLSPTFIYFIQNLLLKSQFPM